jgi:hypothetical protein
LESTIPFTIPRKIQKELIISRAKALLLKRYTKVSDAKTIKELYINTSGVFEIKLNAEAMLHLDASSTKNTTHIDSNACHIKE